MLSRHPVSVVPNTACQPFTRHSTLREKKQTNKKNITEPQNTKPQPAGTAPDTRRHTSDANIHSMFGLWDRKTKTCPFSILSSRCRTWSQNAVTVYCSVCSTPYPTHHQHVDHWHRSKVKKAPRGSVRHSDSCSGCAAIFLCVLRRR